MSSTEYFVLLAILMDFKAIIPICLIIIVIKRNRWTAGDECSLTASSTKTIIEGLQAKVTSLKLRLEMICSNCHALKPRCQ